ncbi:MAG: SpoIIE family protein phosphatase [Planctomycetota bacterium]
MSYVLEIVDRSGRNYTVPLDRFPFTIGRGADNDLPLPYSSVSRQHARIEERHGELTITDLKSRNFVFVNGQRINSLKIREGDKLTIGVIDLKLEHTERPSIPDKSDDLSQQTMFFGQQDEWDPIQALSSAFDKKETSSPVTPKEIDWQRLLRLALESSSSEVYESIIDLLSTAANFDRCFIIRFREGSTEDVELLAKRESSSRQSSSQMYMSREILRRVAASREAVLVSTEDGQGIDARQSFIQTAKTALCFPLIGKAHVNGVLYLDSQSTAFTKHDLNALAPVAGVLALKLENQRLQEIQVQDKLDKKELEIASEVQAGLFPKTIPKIPGFSLEGFNAPCYEVGGDCFDFYVDDGKDLTVLLGDVSGKGLSASLYSVSVLSTLRAHLRDGLDIDEAMSRVESYVIDTFRSDYFLTFFMAKLDRESGILRYCNAGHLPPLILRGSGEDIELERGEGALNIVEFNKFTVFEYQLEPGDLLLAYTDGLIECEGSDGPFGTDRATAFIKDRRSTDLRELRESLMEELTTFAGDSGLDDDITLIFLRRDAEDLTEPTRHASSDSDAR